MEELTMNIKRQFFAACRRHEASTGECSPFLEAAYRAADAAVQAPAA